MSISVTDSTNNKWVPWLIASGLFVLLMLLMRFFGTTLINDEYAAVDYIYRIAREGGFYPTPYKLHKPLALVMAIPAWLLEEPRAYEVLVFALAGLMVFFIYRCVADVFGANQALICAVLAGLHFNTLQYSLEGSSMITSSSLILMGTYAALRLEDSPRAIWLYGAAFFLAGLVRPEAWLFCGPILLYGFLHRKEWGFVRPVLCSGLILLSPLIWFGKDYFINDNLFHSVVIAFRDKAVGTGAYFSFLRSVEYLIARLVEKFSWPAGILSVLGASLFIGRRGYKGLIHPFVLFPSIIAVYIVVLVNGGVYPLYRYYYFPVLFLIIFAVYFLFSISSWIRKEPGLWRACLAVSLPLAGALISLSAMYVWPREDPYSIMVLLSCLLLALLGGLAYWPRIRQGPFRVSSGILVVLCGVSYLLYQADGLYKSYEELRLEAQKQVEMIEVAGYLARQIPEDETYRILMPSRRNEQLNWLFRDREIPDVFSFREAFYIEEFKGISFLDLKPDWIVYLPGDYQFWGPRSKYDWLKYQDRTELFGVLIELVHSTELMRIFKVAYPEGWPERQPLPSIP